MPIVHHPFNIQIGPLPLTGFGIAVMLAFVLSNFIAEKELERRGHPDYAKAIPDLIIASILGTLVGGKLYYAGIITHDWRDLFGRAGFVFWGGFTGAVLFNWLYIRYKKFSFCAVRGCGGRLHRRGIRRGTHGMLGCG